MKQVENYAQELIRCLQQNDLTQLGLLLGAFEKVTELKAAQRALEILPILENLFEDNRGTVSRHPVCFLEIRDLAMRAYVNLKKYGANEDVVLTLENAAIQMSVPELESLAEQYGIANNAVPGDDIHKARLNRYEQMRASGLLAQYSEEIRPRSIPELYRDLMPLSDITEPRNYLHPDYWCEVPGGTFQAGLTESNKDLLLQMMLKDIGFDKKQPDEQHQIMYWVEKKRRGDRSSETIRQLVRLHLNPDIFDIPARDIHLKRFYIARFQVTDSQYDQFARRTHPSMLPGVFEEPDMYLYKEPDGMVGSLWMRGATKIQSPSQALDFCHSFDGRLPSDIEWEKAARGTDGRLFPWGNDWNENHGWFYSEQDVNVRRKGSVDAYPQGASPYGVVGMAGGLPDLVTVAEDSHHAMPDKQKRFMLKGRHPKESSRQRAWIHHLLVVPGFGDWASFRPVIEQWPRTQWVGIELNKPEENEHNCNDRDPIETFLSSLTENDN